MELVYLWVEDYKNIRQQGFNFSGRYRCHYDGVNLTIIENKDYVHIFPENINVTAIVGKNGSGKSSVLVGLTDHKILIEKDGELCSNDFTGSEIKKLLDRQKDYEIIYVDFDLIKINPIRDWWDWSGFGIHNKNLYTKIENGPVGDDSFNIYKFREKFYNLIVEYKQSFDSNLFIYNPSKIILSDYIHEVNSKEERWVRVNQLIKDTEHDSLTIEKFLVFIYSNLNNQVALKLPNIEILGDLTTHEAILLEHAQYMKIQDFQSLYDFFNSLNQFEEKHQISIEAFIPIYNNHKEAFLKLIEIGYLKTNFKDDIGREYDDLSHGERKLFTEHLMIHDAITKTDKQDIFVVLDEPDLTLHPEWQRKYLNETIHLLSTHDKNFHLIITSHSPFILSDIPKQNVIFLEDGKQVDVNIDTFGANIHTLLSHGFFMQDGLMGEFAKSKINEIIDFHKKVEADNEIKKVELKVQYEEQKKAFWNIQSIIGEAYLKQVVKNHLIEIEKILLGKDEAKNAEIKRVEVYLASLQK